MRRQKLWTRKNLWLMGSAVAAVLIAVYALSLEQTPPRFAEITGETVYQNDVAMIDASNTAMGYVAVKYMAETEQDLLVKIVKGKSTHTYMLNNRNEYEVFSFSDGSGNYEVKVYRQVKGSQFTQVYSHKVTVALQEEDIPYLYPNQYVWYTADTGAVSISQELCAQAMTDQEKVEILSDYVLRALSYDHIKSKTVKPGYIPDIDAVLSSRRGICFDYSAVFACMLRVQNIPTKLVIGYADKYYHAWNTVLIDGKWEQYDLTFTDSGTRITNYTQEAVY